MKIDKTLSEDKAYEIYMRVARDYRVQAALNFKKFQDNKRFHYAFLEIWDTRLEEAQQQYRFAQLMARS